MTVETYLKQGIFLDRRIKYQLQRIAELRASASDIAAPALKADKVQTSSTGEARFVKALEKVDEIQEQVNRELNDLLALKKQIESVIHQVGNEEYELVLSYRYLQNKSWAEIADQLYVGKTTVKRWHGKAIQMIILPEHPIIWNAC